MSPQAAGAAPESSDGGGDRLQEIERALQELSLRLDLAEARAAEAEARAAAAEARADDALRGEQALQAELAAARAEFAKREEPLTFPELASDVETRIGMMQDRIAIADRTVRALARQGPGGADVPGRR